jgi:tetratricopeptide (TPR) repeat protein
LQNALASTRWMRGDGAAFARDYEAAVARHPDALFLRLGCADLLRRADQRERAETLLREGLQRTPGDPQIQGALGVVLDELDRTAEALPLLTNAAAALPDVAFMRGNLISALLRLSRSEEALRHIEPLRAAQPFNGDWIAYQGMAWRQLGDARYQSLCDYEVMVRAYDLDAPPGYATMTTFNEALRDSLNRLHVLETHPLDQSLRHGSQTTRSLLTIDDPVIKQYLKALEAPIRAYIGDMREPDHPWSGRKNERFKFSGCWSVKLKPKGYHINHLHPEGWISSAYYVSLPEVTRSGQGQEGWIKFGEPRWPTPGCTVEKVVQPKEGRLVLFPSYMWHGTIPFSEGERLTAPFDVVPA